MGTFIVTWNPDKWRPPPGEREEEIELTRSGLDVRGRWSVGIRQSGINPGDRIYMLRQRADRGLVASGYADSEIFDDLHWDGSGRLAPYIDIWWDKVVPIDDRLPVEDLRGEIPEVAWDRLQGSGVQVKPQVEHLLDELWEEATGDFHDPDNASDPELVTAQQAVTDAVSPLPQGQRPASSVARRQAIEAHAMATAVQHWEEQGWSVEDVSASSSYDLRCTRGNELLLVEVKGTSGDGSVILLTANEVNLAQGPAPTALIVVSGIEVSGTAKKPTTRGGTVLVIDPWNPSEADLTATAFRYSFPPLG